MQLLWVPPSPPTSSPLLGLCKPPQALRLYGSQEGRSSSSLRSLSNPLLLGQGSTSRIKAFQDCPRQIPAHLEILETFSDPWFPQVPALCEPQAKLHTQLFEERPAPSSLAAPHLRGRPNSLRNGKAAWMMEEFSRSLCGQLPQRLATASSIRAGVKV